MQESTMNRVLLIAAVIGLSVGVVPMGAASAQDQRYVGYQRGQGAGWSVEEVGPSTPAARAGLRPGDRITAIDGGPVKNFDDIMRRVNRSGRSVVVDVERASRHRRLTMVPRALTRSEREEYAAPPRRVLGIVHREQRFILRPGTGANDVYIPPPIPPEPPTPPPPMIVN
jgi:membrane-associated protease RseP (regulator of RpoE activity)